VNVRGGRRRVTNSLNYRKKANVDRKGIPVIVQIAMITIVILVILIAAQLMGYDPARIFMGWH